MEFLQNGRSGPMQLVAGATIISFSAVFVKLAHVGPAIAGFYRVLFGGLVLLAIILLKKDRLWFGFYHFAMVSAAAIFFTFDLAFWHRSISYVGPGLATLLGNFQVFFVTAFGIAVLKERVTLRAAGSIFLAMAGLYMIVGYRWHDFGPGYRQGIIFGLFTALCYSGYILTLRKSQGGKYSGKDSPTSLAAMTSISLLTAPIMGVEAWVQGETFNIPDFQSLAALTGYGLGSQACGWMLIARGLSKVDVSIGGLILLLQPTLAFIWDILFFGRITVPTEILGAAIALAAIYLGSIRNKS